MITAGVGWMRLGRATARTQPPDAQMWIYEGQLGGGTVKTSTFVERKVRRAAAARGWECRRLLLGFHLERAEVEVRERSPSAFVQGERRKRALAIASRMST